MRKPLSRDGNLAEVPAYKMVGQVQLALQPNNYPFNSVALRAAREARRCMNRNESSKLGERNDRQRQTVLGTTLKRLYANVADQPVPDSLLSLLEQADRKRQS